MCISQGFIHTSFILTKNKHKANDTQQKITLKLQSTELQKKALLNSVSSPHIMQISRLRAKFAQTG